MSRWLRGSWTRIAGRKVARRVYVLSNVRLVTHNSRSNGLAIRAVAGDEVAY
jgi:hypothetical protein